MMAILARRCEEFVFRHRITRLRNIDRQLSVCMLGQSFAGLSGLLLVRNYSLHGDKSHER